MLNFEVCSKSTHNNSKSYCKNSKCFSIFQFGNPNASNFKIETRYLPELKFNKKIAVTVVWNTC